MSKFQTGKWSPPSRENPNIPYINAIKRKTFFTFLKILKTKPPSKYLSGKRRFKFLLLEYLDNKMYIDVKETIKKYFLAKMKEVYGDALSLEPILNFKKS